jgi:hypothetical protein
MSEPCEKLEWYLYEDIPYKKKGYISYCFSWENIALSKEEYGNLLSEYKKESSYPKHKARKIWVKERIDCTEFLLRFLLVEFWYNWK